MYPKSDAIFDSIPVNILMNVIHRLGAFSSNSLIPAFINPLLSATPSPSMATITMPNGANQE